MTRKGSAGRRARPHAGPHSPRTAVAAGLLLAALAAAPAFAADITTTIPSGLSWRSGASAASPCLAQLRKRVMDANNSFIGHQSFPGMVSETRGAQPKAKLAPLWVVSLPLLPSSNKGQFAQCAAGAFDGYFRQMGANLKAGGAQGTVVRLGWEANIGSHSHPWGVDNAGQIPAYVACWRRAAGQLRAGGPGLLVEWSNAKKGKVPALSMYPGDDAVDLWGVHYYDTGPEKNTQATWDKYFTATYKGSPWGIGAWLAAAKAHGKRLGVGEWGVWRQGGQSAAQADDPVYVDNMYRFFKSNAGSIAYDTYIASDSANGGHALCPSTAFPKAAARYGADWSAGH